jgi:hypothetical protein
MPTLICSCSEEHYTRKHDTFLRSFVRTYSELTPQKILDKLLDDHHDQYNASDSKKLRRQITRLRAKVYESRNGRGGNLNNTFARIHSLCEEHHQDLHDRRTHEELDAHQPLTVPVEIDAAARVALILVTTLHWLRNAARSMSSIASLLMHDTTHGLIFGGAQVWAIGTLDCQHHGHRVALSIVNKQGADTGLFTKLLHKLKDCIDITAKFMQGTAAVLYKPVCCIADAADELTNAMKNVFPGILAIMCYYHWKVAVNKMRVKFNNQDHAARFLAFINNMFRCTTGKVVDFAMSLLERELRRVNEMGFLAYWLREWAHRVCSPGKLPWGMATTNNAIEKWNDLLKRDCGKAMTNWTKMFSLLLRAAHRDSRREAPFERYPDMRGKQGREWWEKGQQLWYKGHGGLCLEATLHDGTEVILMPCEAAVKKLQGSTLAQKRDAHDEVAKEWVTAFMHVHEDPAAAEQEWLGHGTEIIDDLWQWYWWYGFGSQLLALVCAECEKS